MSPIYSVAPFARKHDIKILYKLMKEQKKSVTATKSMKCCRRNKEIRYLYDTLGLLKKIVSIATQ
jgi:hypothetical protein